MSKLHEVLAVEPDKKGVADKVLKEAIDTFHKKQDHFTGQNRSYQPLADDGEQYASEDKEMITTVIDKLAYTENALTNLIDLLYQKDEANTRACANLEVDGQLLAKDVPATVLLNLENRFKAIRIMYDKIPTLSPEETWDKDEKANNTWKAAPKYTYKTKKEIKAVILYPHTDKHPAMVEKVPEDVRQGTWTTVKWSGMLSSKQKSHLLARVDILLQAIKKARVRANDVEIKDLHLGDKLFSFIHS